MTHVNAALVRETTTTTGAGTYSLAGNVTNYRDFDSVMADGDRCWYAIRLGPDFEVGIGTFTSGSPDTLARTTILESSNSNNAVNWGAGTKDIYMIQAPELAISVVGQCRLARTNATTLTLSRDNGWKLFIAGCRETIPAAGVTLSNSGLSANTAYNIYAYMSGGTMTLEASTTARATDSSWGHQIKSGDAARTLVGKIRTNASSQFVDTQAQRFVINWFNQRELSLKATDLGGATTAAAAFVELDNTKRAEFLSWGTGDLTAALGAVQNVVTSGAPVAAYISIGLNGTGTTLGSNSNVINTNNQGYNNPCSGPFQPAEGYNFLTYLGGTLGATVAYYGYVHAMIRG